METRIDVKTRIVKCCDNESSRYALGGVCVTGRGQEGVLCATDGRTLVAMPVDCEGEPLETVFEAANSGQPCAIVPSEVLPTSIKKQEKSRPRLSLNGRADFGGKYGAYVDGRFPQFAYVLSTPLHAQECVAFTIDAQLLLNIAQAVNGPSADRMGVTLILERDKIGDCPIRVMASEDLDGIGAVAVLMPLAQDNRHSSSPECHAAKHLAWMERAKAIVKRLPKAFGEGLAAQMYGP